MKISPLMLLGGAAVVLYLMKQNSASISTAPGTAQMATGSIVPTPTEHPLDTSAQLHEINREIAGGASPAAGKAEAALVSQGSPTTVKQINANIDAGVMTVGSTPNSTWTGVGFFNPYTGITHVPTSY